MSWPLNFELTSVAERVRLLVTKQKPPARGIFLVANIILDKNEVKELVDILNIWLNKK